MFWVGLSMMIMSLTGKGDDTAAFRRYLDAWTKALSAEVSDPARQKKALSAVDKTRRGFRTMRDQYNDVAKCLEDADRRYQVTREDYERCLAPVDGIWDSAVDTLISSRHVLQANTTPEEYAAIAHRMAKEP